jgi:hypothetical protein
VASLIDQWHQVSSAHLAARLAANPKQQPNDRSTVVRASAVMASRARAMRRNERISTPSPTSSPSRLQPSTHRQRSATPRLLHATAPRTYAQLSLSVVPVPVITDDTSRSALRSTRNRQRTALHPDALLALIGHMKQQQVAAELWLCGGYPQSGEASASGDALFAVRALRRDVR